MTRKYSETKVREALSAMDLDVVVYKPVDNAGRAQNTKPADFMVWWHAEGIVSSGAMSAWLEIKECPNLDSFPFSLIRPSQWAAMRDAERIELPYYLVVYWKARKLWTVTTSRRLLAADEAGDVSMARVRFPLECRPAELENHLRGVLLGEID